MRAAAGWLLLTEANQMEKKKKTTDGGSSIQTPVVGLLNTRAGLCGQVPVFVCSLFECASCAFLGAEAKVSNVHTWRRAVQRARHRLAFAQHRSFSFYFTLICIN